MSNKKFSVAQSLKFGFYGIFDHFRLFFWVAVVSAIVYIATISTFFIVSPLGVIRFFKEARTIQSAVTFKSTPEQSMAEEPSTPVSTQNPGLDFVEQAKTKWNGVMAKVQASLNRIINMLEWKFFITLLLVLLIFTGIWLGYTKITLDVYDKDTAHVKTLFSYFLKAPSALIATAIYLLIVWLGLMLFIVPGIYAFLRLGYYRHLMVDKDAGIIDSLRKSADITAGNGWSLFSLSLGMFLIPLSVLPLIFFAKNAVLLASTAAYRVLSPKK